MSPQQLLDSLPGYTPSVCYLGKREIFHEFIFKSSILSSCRIISHAVHGRDGVSLALPSSQFSHPHNTQLQVSMLPTRSRRPANGRMPRRDNCPIGRVPRLLFCNPALVPTADYHLLLCTFRNFLCGFQSNLSLLLSLSVPPK